MGRAGPTMILPDVNVLVYAFREGEHDHRVYSDWLVGLISGEDELALLDTVLAGFVRVVTNARVSDPPASLSRALGFVEDLRTARRVRWLMPGNAVWEHLGAFAMKDRGIAGNRVPDAYIAASAIVNGAQLATADRGFARFPELRWFDPRNQ